ncbi:hypothetical protein C1X64_27875 [Pseudomonas sp. GW456-E7]|nr:hypothetical protein C1X64_27875 [Pseudomonas sp. GW456-E7]
MKFASGFQLLAIGFAFSSASVCADEGEWQIDVSSYGWLPKTTSGVETPFGTATSELSASDAVDSLDAALMGTVSARKGRWSLVGDVFYMDLSFRDRTPFARLFSDIDTRTTLASVAGYGLYEVLSLDRFRLDAGLGLRWVSNDVDVSLRGISRPDYDVSVHDSWVDPLLAVRVSAQLSDRWRAVLWVDGGGGDIGDASRETWQITSVVSFKVSEQWSVSGGYRHLYIDRESDGVAYDLKLSGPILGASFSF